MKDSGFNSTTNDSLIIMILSQRLTHIFQPVALETLGPINTARIHFLSELLSMLTWYRTYEKPCTPYKFHQNYNLKAFKHCLERQTVTKDAAFQQLAMPHLINVCFIQQ